MRKFPKKAARIIGLFWPDKSKKPALENIQTAPRHRHATCLGMLRSVLQFLSGKLRFLSSPDVIPTLLIKIAEVL